MSAAVGQTRYRGVKYHTIAQNITGLLEAGTDGINHGELVRLIDAVVARLMATVRHRSGWYYYVVDRYDRLRIISLFPFLWDFLLVSLSSIDK